MNLGQLSNLILREYPSLGFSTASASYSAWKLGDTVSKGRQARGFTVEASHIDGSPDLRVTLIYYQSGYPAWVVIMNRPPWGVVSSNINFAIQATY